LSTTLITNFALRGESVFGTSLAHKILWRDKHYLTATIALLKVFFKANILNDLCVEHNTLVYFGDDFLSKNCANIISGVGFVVFLVDLVCDVLVFDFLYF
jgi:hypothetical protein